ncbi:hypothetical protein PV08_04477 [Exophiala spinifera]|uniref:Phosphatidylinositol transfer protein SFH5 n=1 Tax=Exophiala spinifera TaxID=91928 RepID=A0A0D1YPY1_9EURO|nr:uncharacterized protein PV08_04477 [Exophiala spinifera]KIW17286.1 hypothetical protein PV08_04477 [Exophiala spinifera]
MASADTSAAPNSTTLPAEVSGVVVADESGKTDAAVPVPEEEEKNKETPTTDAPNSTTLPGEVSGVIPSDDTAAEKKDVAPAAAPTPAPASTATEKEEKKEVASPIQELWALAQSHGHPEIWGVTLADPSTHVPTQVVLQKYLNANDGDVAKAKDQLTKTLEWRAKMKPLELMKTKKFSRAKFEGLGYVTCFGSTAEDAEPGSREVFTWNIYGNVKNVEETFGDLQEFLSWRVVLMEEALQLLHIDKATAPITADHDPYKIVQVHDYKSISFLRQSPVVKAASTETIKVFAQNYPELLKEKFFVNVPALMGFIYAFVKLFVAAKTIKKFHPMSNGANLAGELATSTSGKSLNLPDLLPKEYGGKGPDLNASGKQTALD